MLKYPQGETYAKKETKDSTGTRDTRAHQKRVRKEPQKGSQAQVNAPKLEEVVSGTSPVLRSGDCIAKNTRSGSLEDA